jgi:hypothetical protein
MEISDNIKKLIFDYWRKNGVDISKGFFNMFGITRYYMDDPEVQEMVIEFYGGVDNVIEKLKKLTNVIINTSNFKFYIDDVSYDSIDGEFRFNVIVDGGQILETEYEGEQELYTLYMVEGLDREFSEFIREDINETIYKVVSEKTGVFMSLDIFNVTQPGEFKV